MNSHEYISCYRSHARGIGVIGTTLHNPTCGEERGEPYLEKVCKFNDLRRIHERIFGRHKSAISTVRMAARTANFETSTRARAREFWHPRKHLRGKRGNADSSGNRRIAAHNYGLRGGCVRRGINAGAALRVGAVATHVDTHSLGAA